MGPSMPAFQDSGKGISVAPHPCPIGASPREGEPQVCTVPSDGSFLPIPAAPAIPAIAALGWFPSSTLAMQWLAHHGAGGPVLARGIRMEISLAAKIAAFCR